MIKRPRLTKEHYRWMVLAAVVGVLYYMGDIMFHLKHPLEALIVLVVLTVVLVFAFYLLRDKAAAK